MQAITQGHPTINLGRTCAVGIMAAMFAVLLSSAAAQTTDIAFGMDADAERKLLKQIGQCEQEKRWQEMAALCYDAIGRTQKQVYYDRLLVAIDNQKRPSELADVIFSYMLRFPSLREGKYTPWAVAMRETGRGDEAATQLQQWVSSMPAEVAAWTALATLQSDLKKFADAESTFRKAKESVRDQASCQRLRMGLARLYVATSDANRAIAEYDEVITMAPGIPGYSAQEAVSELTRFLTATNRLDEYVTSLEARLREPAKEKATLEIILAIIDQRTHPKAIAFRRRLAELEPTSASYLQLRDLTERRRATNDEIYVIEKMLVLFPETRASWQNRLMDLYVATGDSAKAIPIIEGDLRNQTNALPYAQAAGTALALGDRGLASRWLEQARKNNPDNQAMATIARVLLRMDRHEEALSITLTMPSSATGQQLRSEIMAEMEKTGKRDMVISALTKMTGSDPTNSTPWSDLARLYTRANDLTNSATAWRRVTEIAPSHDAYQNLIACLRSTPDSASLLQATESYFKAFPGVETGKSLAPMLVKAGRTADALSVQRQVVDLLKTPAEKVLAQIALIRVLVSERQYPDARKLLDETTPLATSGTARDEIDKLRAAVEANEKHEEFVRKAIDKAEKNPRDPAAQRSAAQALRITGQPMRAADYYRRALAIEDQTATRWDLAYVLTAAKQHREAVKAYQDLLGRDLTAQERDSAIKAVAESYDALGESDKTLKFLADNVDDIKTPYIKTWATARIQALRGQPK